MALLTLAPRQAAEAEGEAVDFAALVDAEGPSKGWESDGDAGVPESAVFSLHTLQLYSHSFLQRLHSAFNDPEVDVA